MAAIPEPASPTREAIFRGYEEDRDAGFRPHLGASLIGHPCERALWYSFRWASPATFPGRILRLFETGHLEEARLVRNLRRTGATVLDLDPATGRQWRVTAHGGHFGGSLDAVALGLLEAPKTWHVVEFKTHSAKSFRDLVAKGVATSKPRHAAQMQIYMALTGLTRALYVAVCKDNDDLHVERIRADADEAERLLAKAERVIFAQHPPARISDDPAWFECRFCEHAPVCHESAAPPQTCRSCLHATPREDGDGFWHCARHDRALSLDEQRAGCPRHLFIPDFVPGVVTDAGEDHVAYRLADGTVWTNDAREGAPC